MKLLLFSFLIFPLITFAQESPEIRKLKARVDVLNNLRASSPCDLFASEDDKATCKKELESHALKEAKAIAKSFGEHKINVSDKKVGAEIKEELEVARFRSLLDSAGVTYSLDDSSQVLKQKYRGYQEAQREAQCIAHYSDLYDRKGVVYDPTWSCDQMRANEVNLPAEPSP